jgi:signal transduction histidine kinase
VAYYLDHFQRRQPFEMEYRLRRGDGEYRWIFDRGVPFSDEAGAFAGFIGSCVDVDERRRTHEAQQIKHIVGDLLDLSREREGGIPIEPKPSDLRTMCRQIIDELEAIATQRKITFDCDADGAGAWDEHRLLQAISNLTSNATVFRLVLPRHTQSVAAQA